MASESLAARARALLAYDPLTGVFTRKVRTAQRHQVGDRADKLIATGIRAGYRVVAFDGEKFLAHRLAWLYVNGSWPQHNIDHMNGDRGDNRIANLRDVPQWVNAQNRRKPQVNSSTNVLGVVKSANGQAWIARVCTSKRTKYIGTYATKEEAHLAYLTAKRNLHVGCTV